MLPLQAILLDCGIHTGSYTPVTGGDINKAFCVQQGPSKYFLKTNHARLYPGMLAQEAEGLKALQHTGNFIIPNIIRHGIVEQQQYLLLEWIDRGNPSPGFWEHFGCGLAQMHVQPQPFFGWHCNNYIGSLPQVNTARHNWHSFYAESRLMPLMQQLHTQGAVSATVLKDLEKLCTKLPVLFPEEPPALLHGDLWSGNYMVAANGNACVYDPAVYFGHREMDIGMSRLFGGFHRRFYEAYHYHYPLQPGWEERLPLTQLYPLLVHALLFGGHYVQEAAGIIQDFC
ncbi:MAG TPA: fructosamine kinase family protein [Ferruginibacter sp.]|nr:fructosamine kinase family protein [Ferruginibacter sp.]HMP19558.1 fructosamine kinase family protein [Ferruginibacter sp.]